MLNHIRQHEWNSYGHTILNFAGYLSSREIFFVSSGIGGSYSQLKQRITAIASYRRPSKKTQLAGFSLLLILWLLFSPFVQNHNLLADSVSGKPDRPFVPVDLSTFFPENEGCFVLYDENKNQYSIYNEKMSRQRVSPDSTYKIYSALAALDAGVISPGKSEIAWDQKQYPFSSWNKDQTLDSAMSSSVNWYFQTLDQRLGKTALKKTLRRIRYGNEDISGGITSFWLESSLKISPLEQVMLLRDFDQNRLGCSEKTARAVRNSIRLNCGPGRILYGKTGTGCIDGHDINGWFIGILKTKDNTYCFALRIKGRDGASGKEAAQTALKIIRSLSL
ncbi:penicillin-binding transpeptidase domain-containing protein [Anaerostipes faecis]|uniref:penicillin-binding transpeptidase domain-containing protein n=1 Tax=Anaerostipes faecis TaxID=2880702 RepID=UPI00265B03D3|nr:penicillin-binding transpeptidase domain-containing protein [Anaerostipes faecis]